MASCVEDPGRLRDLYTAIVAGVTTPTELMKRYLDRIETVQPIAEPWRVVDAERAMAVAELRERQAAAGHFLGPLHGIPFGVKDVIDAEALPTRCNCRALQDAAPAVADAEVVLALKAAGAIVLGKLHTTEFAFFDPSPARNPHDTDYTPGGSSSGSGAAVSSGTVPLALGTQTMASLNRPAAYCGISAFKPSTRSVSSFGMGPLAPSFDTIGFYGWSVDDAVYAYEAVATTIADEAVLAPPTGPLKIVFIEDNLIADMDDSMRAAVDEQLKGISLAGHTVSSAPSPFPMKRLVELHWIAMVFEAGRTLGHLLRHPEDQVGKRLRDMIAEGQTVPEEQYLAVRSEINALRKTFFATFGEEDVFLWPAAPGPATKGIQSTGEPRYIAPWTVLGGPMVTLPCGKTESGLPLGSIISMRPGKDMRMTTIARALAGH